MLLEAGANPNLQLKLFPPYRNQGNDRGLDGMLTIGTTPLLRAAKALDAPAVKLLVDHGAKLDLPNNRGITPIMAAAGMGSSDADTRGYYTTEDTPQRSVDTLKILLDAGADVNSQRPAWPDTASRGREMGMERRRAVPCGSRCRPQREISRRG